ncbi:hypothetical protein [Kocuria rosea]|uniref:hypothetical protein n=1 Tax=Kocuria rosea TaxID=1275 RepID=UPI003D3586E5
MAQSSYPKAKAAEQPLGEAQWKQLMLPLGRGIIDEGGSPYRVTARDSVTDTVTIGVDTRKGYNSAILDGFLHYMDSPEQLSVPPVSVDTVYEIGLVFDPTKISDLVQGPITLTAWKAPGDMTGGKSRLVLHTLTRKPNISLGSTTVSSPLPRAVPAITVSTFNDLPTKGLVLVDTLAGVRTTGLLYRANIAANGDVTWSSMGAADVSGDIDAKINAALGPGWAQATPYADANSIVRRWDSGVIRVGTSVDHPQDALNRGAGDARYSRPGHTHAGADITSRIPFEHVDGSADAWSNSNLGSSWTSVAVNSSGFFGRYPSARKYKKNITPWNPDPQTIVDMIPVTYDVKVTEAGHSDDQSSDRGLIGFTADDYVTTRRELVLKVGEEVEGFHYHLMPVAQQVVLRWHEDRLKTVEAENQMLKHNLTALTTHLGLSVDGEGRLIIEGETVPDAEKGA